MWVVKLGGSLQSDPVLPQWLELLEQLGGGRVTIVCGGGRFADEVRRTQAHWQFDDLPAHNMAILAMAQSAYMAQGLNGRLGLAHSDDDIRQVLRRGRTALWLPLDMVAGQPGPRATWDVTSDSIALDLARRLNAERLVVVKSCPVAPGASLDDLTEAGVLDAAFAAGAHGAAFDIDVVHRADLGRMRALLLGERRSLDA